MLAYKREFIDFMVRAGVLSFGDFVTKSGRRTPFFINTGLYGTGAQLMRLGRFYAEAIVERFGHDFDVLFGPAYKGIPLVACTAIALAEQHGKDAGFCFNRKEAKLHGEGGMLVGKPLTDGARVVIVEDVTTAGTSIRETLPVLQAAANIQLRGLLVAVDRMERGTGQQSALSEIRQTFQTQAFSIVTIDEIIESLEGRVIDGQVVLSPAMLDRLAAYRQEYGAKNA